ncbi:putative leucine-rich repeat receptor-like serine/threonine-protein kinase [Iris pallida]|uniref:Leucine-rich repeat receptor-like serine/threonine-protein kinase n=1 Tax=Iris pallida TaxID=29817 RepID=A0AAX6ERI9_IRIPA|nr:putative leucine-rich repeat receptor-like serine/threonine-protein kinase [Iris pallida]
MCAHGHRPPRSRVAPEPVDASPPDATGRSLSFDLPPPLLAKPQIPRTRRCSSLLA